jgi:hypothetical protein
MSHLGALLQASPATAIETNQRGGGTMRKHDREHERETTREKYAAAFERVRLVRAWIAAAAALVTVISAYVAVIERLLR